MKKNACKFSRQQVTYIDERAMMRLCGDACLRRRAVLGVLVLGLWGGACVACCRDAAHDGKQ